MPDDYDDPKRKLRLFGRSVTKHEKPIVPPNDTKELEQRPYLVYLEGGPGFGNPAPQDHVLTKAVLERGYQLLLLDYRGTGLSTPITAATVTQQGDTAEQAAYLRLFRQDSNVKDLEAVREILTKDFPPERKKWSVFGQSFGGFVILSYLSFRPEGLREAFMTGGLAPIGRTAKEVYEQTFQKVIERNKAYYEKYPEDVKTVNDLAVFIQSKGGAEGIALPAGGRLTVPRFLTLGVILGGHGGIDSLHGTVLRMAADLKQFGYFTRPTLSALEAGFQFDVAPIYAILHEAIYCFKPGVSSKWSAQSIGETLPEYKWLTPGWDAAANAYDQLLYFSGEMVFPLHFDTYGELPALKGAAEILAQHDEWPALYDEEQLGRNTVPVYAVSYNDMYVVEQFARETVSKVRGIKVYETNVLYHTAIRQKTEEVLPQIFRLRDDTID